MLAYLMETSQTTYIPKVSVKCLEYMYIAQDTIALTLRSGPLQRMEKQRRVFPYVPCTSIAVRNMFSARAKQPPSRLGHK
jgi:hypothetical protein